ncbi:hypothetical protein [Phascolarctobacterium succinatutens]|uniref:hypothetical protein n=1 Tax=Phascolarctobacterium succinatutens TaxID=626940 RepID=UPI0020673230|nr:MAG TPA: hypothetical protein [Caudoviricetes sp.]
MSAKVDLTGQRFGRLVVIKELPRKTALRKTPLWLCQCDCGNTCEAYSDSLRGGKKSCGCILKERRRAAEAKRAEGEAIRAKNKALLALKCPFPANCCYKSRHGMCCLDCYERETCEDRCLNTPTKCGYSRLSEVEHGVIKNA